MKSLAALGAVVIATALVLSGCSSYDEEGGPLVLRNVPESFSAEYTSSMACKAFEQGRAAAARADERGRKAFAETVRSFADHGGGEIKTAADGLVKASEAGTDAWLFALDALAGECDERGY